MPSLVIQNLTNKPINLRPDEVDAADNLIPALVNTPFEIDGTNIDHITLLGQLGEVKINPISGPMIITAPVMVGVPKVGVAYKYDDDTWYGNPEPTFSISWFKSSNGQDSWSAIPGTNSNTYTPVAGDVGMFLLVVVTATNEYGTEYSESDVSPAVTDA